jgi:uncharacterized membrane protein YgdD (TMEM256/DUF423 family)
MHKVPSRGGWILVVAALLGALGLVLSATSAHALAALIDPADLSKLTKANRYLSHYSLVLLVLGVLYRCWRWPELIWVALLFSVGVGIFSGSLYILCLTQISAWAWLTPLGGISLLLGWLALAVACWRRTGQERTDD